MSIILLKDTTCCGLKELNYINRYQNPKDVIIRVYMDTLQTSRGAFLFFTDAIVNRSGERLAKEIKENKLGVLIETRKKRNPNSGYLIKVYVWERDDKKLKKYFDKNADDVKKERVKEYLRLKEASDYDKLDNFIL